MGGTESGGAMVLGKLPVPGRPTTWITVGQGPTALAAGAGCLDILLSSILSLLFLPLFGGRPDIDLNIVSKGRETQNNQPTNLSQYEKRIPLKPVREGGGGQCGQCYTITFQHMYRFNKPILLFSFL